MVSLLTGADKDTTRNKYIIWLIGVAFLIFQFFLQLSAGVIIGDIMREQQLSALMAALLGSAFYYVYTSMQIPVGILFDHYNTKTLLWLNAFICAIGCFVFASGQNLLILILGRLVMGGGAAFAFIGMSHLLRQHFPLRQYALMVGTSETLGFSATVLGMIGVGSLVEHLGWRCFIYAAGFIGLLIAALCWSIIPSEKPASTSFEYKRQFWDILKNKYVWLNGWFVCLEFSVITVFGALWAVPFVELKLHCTIKVASAIASMTLLGAALSCPVFGLMSMYFSRRKPLLYTSCLTTAALMVLILFYPTQSPLLLSALFFMIGLCCGAYMLAYSIANELTPPESLSACTGFTNTLAMLSAPLLQPLVGFLLDYLSQGRDYTLQDYQLALLVIPMALILAWVMCLFLPEKS